MKTDSDTVKKRNCGITELPKHGLNVELLSNMTIKEVTQQMLWDIRYQYNREKRTSDKELARILEITPASFSRLITAVTEPKNETLKKIVKLHAITNGDKRNQELIQKLYE